jgi:hypothetical protein
MARARVSRDQIRAPRRLCPQLKARVRGDELCCLHTSCFDVSGSPAVVDAHGAAVDPAQLLKVLAETEKPLLAFRVPFGQ